MLWSTLARPNRPTAVRRKIYWTRSDLHRVGNSQPLALAKQYALRAMSWWVRRSKLKAIVCISRPSDVSSRVSEDGNYTHWECAFNAQAAEGRGIECERINYL